MKDQFQPDDAPFSLINPTNSDQERKVESKLGACFGLVGFVMIVIGILVLLDLFWG